MSRVLLDNSVPRRISRFLQGHSVERAYNMGWASFQNGDLLDALEAAGFEVFVTSDQNLCLQQNLSKRRVAIVVLGTNNWPVIAANPAPISDAVDRAKPGSVSFVAYPKPGRMREPRS